MGPEVALKAVASPRVRRLCRPLLVGEIAVWKRAGWKPGLAELFDTGLRLTAPMPGQPTAKGGRASFEAVRRAFELTTRGIAAGIVTEPISKSSWDFPGGCTDHTEFFARSAGARAEMILCSPSAKLWCVLATRHIPLREVPSALNRAGIVRAGEVLAEALARQGFKRPRLVLCGLNPHAGEQGLLGEEEKRIIIPAARAARSRGIDLSGPLAADAAWRLHREGAYQGIVALYHDQALIPLKTAVGLRVVNWTVGVPNLVRTSPGHGTAFDIAGLGRADAEATIAAAELACRLIGRSWQRHSRS